MLGLSWEMMAGATKVFGKFCWNPTSTGNVRTEYWICGLRPYFEKSQALDIGDQPLETAADEGSQPQRGVKISYPHEYAATHQFWHETLNNLGIPTNPSHLDGSNIGAWTNLATIDPRTQERSYSTTAYLAPIATRGNLSIVTGAEAGEIVFDGGAESQVASEEIPFGGGGSQISRRGRGVSGFGVTGNHPQRRKRRLSIVTGAFGHRQPTTPGKIGDPDQVP